jgi:hypothetical protein
MDKKVTVATVKGKRVKTTAYYVHWKGYSHKDDKWVKEHDMNCPKKVEEFENKKKD